MSSSSERRPPGAGFLNIPAPEGSKAGLSYTRFIPREELGEVQPWQPGSFGALPTRPSHGEQRPKGPSEQEWLARQTFLYMLYWRLCSPRYQWVLHSLGHHGAA